MNFAKVDVEMESAVWKQTHAGLKDVLLAVLVPNGNKLHDSCFASSFSWSFLGSGESHWIKLDHVIFMVYILHFQKRDVVCRVVGDNQTGG